VRAELFRPDAAEVVVAVAEWNGREARLDVKEESAVELDRIFRPTPVVVDDASLRRQGTHGAALLQPGDLEWFRAALLTRAPEFGLSVRFVSALREGGWDPAGEYRTFEEQVYRLSASS
jgi:hypothetical protein